MAAARTHPDAEPERPAGAGTGSSPPGVDLEEQFQRLVASDALEPGLGGGRGRSKSSSTNRAAQPAPSLFLRVAPSPAALTGQEKNQCGHFFCELLSLVRGLSFTR